MRLEAHIRLPQGLKKTDFEFFFFSGIQWFYHSGATTIHMIATSHTAMVDDLM